MNIVPFVHEGLGNSSYLVGFDGGRALLVDPDRNVGRYLDAAAAQGWHVDAVLETHLHADFVSGAHELAAGVGAKLFLPAGAGSRLPHHGVTRAERLTLDGVEVEVVASPGHTPEHVSYVLRSAAHPPTLFSGGSLIVGGAARTDLIAPDMTEPLTRAQYRTLTQAFTALPDETVLRPTHGGGSFCSAGAGATRTSTLGAERATNPLLAFAGEDAFVRWFPTTFPGVPAYYWRMRAVNQAGARLRRDIAMPPALTPERFDVVRRNAIVVDVRPADAYMTAHIPGSLSIPFRDAYAVWLGWLIPEDAALLFVVGDVPVARVVDESLLVGYERFAGVLDGDVRSWDAAGLPVVDASFVDVPSARRALLDGAIALDVREPDEYASGHIEGAMSVPLGALPTRIGDVARDRPVLAYCGHGERSTTAVSVLERAGISAVLNLDGGIDAWRDASYRLVA